MDPLQIQHERAVGDKLVEWINKRDGTHYVFASRGDDAPDLLYEHEKVKLGVEVVGAYYDQSSAAFLWGNARQVPGAPAQWFGVDYDQCLKINIDLRIAEKCSKAYGSNCILLIAVQPNLTPMADFQKLLPSLSLPTSVPFAGIYIAGDFPCSSCSQGGYFVWQLWPPEV